MNVYTVHSKDTVLLQYIYEFAGVYNIWDLGSDPSDSILSIPHCYRFFNFQKYLPIFKFKFMTVYLIVDVIDK